jgi:adsorption protein B
LLGDLLIANGDIRREAFDAVLKDYEPARDGRVGDLLLSRGVVTSQMLSAAVETQRRIFGTGRA